MSGLPDIWAQRWERFEGIAWYRIDWVAGCEGPAEPLGAAFDFLSMAGAIRLNDDLLWRDASLVEPLSRSWNSPRAFALPASALKPGLNRFWVQLAGSTAHGAGLGPVRVAPLQEATAHAARQGRDRRVLMGTNVVISATLGFFFFVLWLMRRQDKAYGWYAFTSLAWVLLASDTVITTTPWPFGSTASWARWTTVWLIVYVCAFSMFLGHFGGHLRPRRARAMWVVAGACMAAVVLLPSFAQGRSGEALFVLCMAVFLSACARFIVRALHTRQTNHALLAACCTAFIVAGVHDALLLLRVLRDAHPLTPVTALLITVGMSLVLAGTFTRNLRRAEQFTDELATQVRLAREDLLATLGREHRLELDNVRLNERLRVAHDLHDSLGSSLVRSVALVEQSGAQLQRQHYLSMFKSLRDDLRQIVDTHGSAAAVVPDTPGQWLAPLRHRFGRLFEELGVRCQWHTPTEWPCVLTAKQSLALTRFLEESLTNVVKHSRARNLSVQMEAEGTQGLALRVLDDGIGFDVAVARQSIGGLGLSSMQARIARAGGVLEIDSGDAGTQLRVTMRAQENASAATVY